MRRTYHVLAHLIAGLVVVQAMMMATAVAGLSHWIDDGATVNKHVIDKHPNFTGSFGFPVHAINGEMLIPLIAIALLVVSFFAKVPSGTRWALYVFGVIVIQVVLGVSAGDVPLLGLLHGLNAFILFAVALLAGRRAQMLESEPVAATASAA